MNKNTVLLIIGIFIVFCVIPVGFAFLEKNSTITFTSIDGGKVVSAKRISVPFNEKDKTEITTNKYSFVIDGYPLIQIGDTSEIRQYFYPWWESVNNNTCLYLLSNNACYYINQ